MGSKINIRPGVSVLAILRHLNYKPWYALGEFVDNSVQSFLKNEELLKGHHGKKFKLLVGIDIDAAPPVRISIRDNAAGIFKSEYARAFRPAEMPPERTGLAEFGMGMKSAACWFAPRWSVRTSAFGESNSRTVRFDIEKIVNDDIDELSVKEVKEDANAHYTEITLEDVFQGPKGKTIAKLKEHLTDMYRVFIRDKVLELKFNGEVLKYQEPTILKVPYFKDKDGPARTWRKDIEFDLGNGLSVHGFAALREKANTARAGFALFRRGRLIQGSGDEGYRPHQIFGSTNSFRYQRLFGELHLEGFEVSHTKDGFRWDDNEEPFLGLLEEYLDESDMPLLKQAEGYRVRAAQKKAKKIAQEAVKNVTQAIKEHLPNVLVPVADAQAVDTPKEEEPLSSLLAKHEVPLHFQLRFQEVDWIIKVELTNDPAESEWVRLSDIPKASKEPRRLNIRVSMAHPFMVRFAQTDSEVLQGLLRVAVALALAEVLAHYAGVSRGAGTIRRNVNSILRDALSEP